MSWKGYIDELMSKPFVMDAAIVGHNNPISQWAAASGGKLEHVTDEEIKLLIQPDRSELFKSGVTLAGNKTTVLRDNLNTEELWTMDIRTKPTDDDANSYSVSIAKSLKALIIVKAKKDVHGGLVNKLASDMAGFLRSQDF